MFSCLIVSSHFIEHNYGILFFFEILFLDRGKGERNINVWLPLAHPTGDLARNPGMCPDWESNQQPFGSQAARRMLNPLSHTSPGWPWDSESLESGCSLSGRIYVWIQPVLLEQVTPLHIPWVSLVKLVALLPVQGEAYFLNGNVKINSSSQGSSPLSHAHLRSEHACVCL